MDSKKIYEKLNLKNPYPYAKSLNLSINHGPDWGGNSDVFSKFIEEKKPNLILELGTFLGNSTITMAKHIKQLNLNCTIIAVDTWLGSEEHWLTEKCNLMHLYKNFEFGISAMYDQFLTNVLSEGAENYIIPMPTTTDTAYDVLKHNELFFDIIYMDADHRENVVYNDLKKYKNLINENGIIFGHDIDWDGVKNAVERFCEEETLKYNIYNDNENHPKFWKL